jgi:hypothetical protein
MRPWLIVLFWVSACARPSTPSAAAPLDDVDRLAARIAVHRTQVDSVEQEVARLGRSWSGVAATYKTAAARYQRARAALDEARATAGVASEQFAEATAAFQRATEKWEMARELILVAAAIDAANLDAARAGRAGATQESQRLDGLDCTSVSTAKFRRLLKRKGVDLTGVDIDHIVPRSLGGADHPLNYQLLDSSTNRRIGALWGPEKCDISGWAECARAAEVSSRCGHFSGS